MISTALLTALTGQQTNPQAAQANPQQQLLTQLLGGAQAQAAQANPLAQLLGGAQAGQAQANPVTGLLAQAVADQITGRTAPPMAAPQHAPMGGGVGNLAGALSPNATFATTPPGVMANLPAQAMMKMAGGMNLNSQPGAPQGAPAGV